MNSPGALSLLFLLSLTGSVLGNLLAIYLLLTRPVVYQPVAVMWDDSQDANCDCGEGGVQ